MKTLYSVRDALGREVYWTTHRATAARIVREVNAIGAGARIYTRAAGAPYAAEAPVYANTHDAQEDAFAPHQLPVALWKCSVRELKPEDTEA